MPLFSVIMPVYNTESTISSKLDTLFAQTFLDIEVIAVNDCSTDETGRILDQYALGESRLKVIHHLSNTYTGQARKDGVLAAVGDYILFVDQDDDLALDACEKLRAAVLEHPVDIIHFGTVGVISGDVVSSYQSTLDAFLRPYDGGLEGDEILSNCFHDRTYSWNIWNKLYRTDLCRRAHEQMDMQDVRYGEDFYAYFLLASYAESYWGMPSEALYTYYYGSGQTGHSSVNLSLFEFTCTAAVVVDRVREFVNSFISPGLIAGYIERVRSLLIWEPACMFKSNVAAVDKCKALRSFLSAWGTETGISILRQVYEGEELSLIYDLGINGDFDTVWTRNDNSEIELFSTEDSDLVWNILDARSRGSRCFILIRFSLADALRQGSTEQLSMAFVACFCDTVVLLDESEAASWYSLGVSTIVLLDQELSDEALRQRILSSRKNAVVALLEEDSFMVRSGPCLLARNLLYSQLRALTRIQQMENQMEKVNREAEWVQSQLLVTNNQLDAALLSTTWKAGAALMWLPCKLKDLLGSFGAR